jgi:glycosyltransferase involved in cell wall biosynthesis
LGVHLAAWRLATTEKLRWVADFRDPMSPALTGNFQPRNSAFAQLEEAVLDRADLVIANTEPLAEAWLRKDARRQGRIQTIMNGFDPEERIQPLEIPRRPYRLITHIGNLYGGRTVEPLVAAVAKLVEDGRLDPRSFQFLLVGTMQANSLPDPDTIERAERQGWLKLIRESIPRADALELAQTSDALLLVQPQSNAQVPGKLFEYIQIGRPVLAYLKQDTPVNELLARSGIHHRVVFSDDSSVEIENTLLEFLTGPLQGRAPSAWFEERFNGKRQAEEFAGLLEEMYTQPGVGAEPLSR